MNPSEELVATLVRPNDYSYHIGEVAAVTTESLLVLKRKLVSAHGYEIVKVPFADCIRITFGRRPTTLKRFAGILLLLLLLAVSTWAFLHWESYADDRYIFLVFGSLLVPAALYLLLGPPRHDLVFELIGEMNLTWSSGYRDVNLVSKNIDGLLAFARERGIDVHIQSSA